ncbi:DUF887-domain-containing protein [Cylindrobasidium torrendii FP15055 ss-10]|uniref:DUF887-domain-containing protein n=1 Tax=Cylindrobasidium torrendii FP15055 ss-10 TaxID=1314674 RepID=A0A0D7B3X7_9AGAR|nr:DUF887-domain-containing protein [Cylindrobasidium torrendii FP15055 ss-10]
METLSNAALAVGLARLPPYLPVFVNSFAAFTALHLVAAPLGSRLLFPDVYGKMSKRQRNNWCIHVVSMAHCIVVLPLAVGALYIPELAQDKAFGWSDEKIGVVTAISCGYFLWDTLDAIINFTDIGFVFHGIACLLIYVGSYKPFLAYYAARCLLWEASTFFLNIHWYEFLDKTNRTGSSLQLFNGLCLLLTFFVVRIVYGGLYSPSFAHTILHARGDIPAPYLLIYGGGNILLNGLNIFWFFKMIQSIRSRFQENGVEATTNETVKLK